MDVSASDVVNNFSEQKLRTIIKILGEEKDANLIAKNIIKARSINKTTNVNQLVILLKMIKKRNYKRNKNQS